MKFKVVRSGDQFMFNVIGRNGQVVATSERYTRKASAVAAIESIRRNAADAAVEDATAAH